MHFRKFSSTDFVMLRLRPRAISAWNVKTTLLPKVKRPLKLFLFCFKKGLGTLSMQLKTSCTLQLKTFQVPGSLQIFGKSLWKMEKWGPEPKLTEVYGKTPTDFIRIWIRLWKSEVIEKSVQHVQNMKFSLGLDLFESFMVMWKSKYTVNGVSDVHIVLMHHRVP